MKNLLFKVMPQSLYLNQLNREAWASPPALSPREPETSSPPGGRCTWGPVGPSLATSSVLEKVLKHGSGSTVDADSFTAFLV